MIPEPTPVLVILAGLSGLSAHKGGRAKPRPTTLASSRMSAKLGAVLGLQMFVWRRRRRAGCANGAALLLLNGDGVFMMS